MTLVERLVAYVDSDTGCDQCGETTVVHECSRCGTSADGNTTQCPRCGSVDIARYEI
ncbi:MAG: hypothetical protein ABEH86_10095 [Haloarcula sp.]